MDSILAAYKAAARADVAGELAYSSMYGAFDTPDSRMPSHLDAWAAAEPENFFPHAAKAEYYIGMAWRARGHAYADDTPDSNFRRMEYWDRKAMMELTAAMKRDPMDPVSYQRMMGIGGREDDSLRVLAFEHGIARSPRSLILRTTFMDGLRPRWGGSYEEMEAFAARCDSAVADNPRLRIVRGYIAMDRGITLMEDKRYHAALEQLLIAKSYGDWWRFHEALTRVYYEVDRYADMHREATLALAANPTNSDLLAYRAIAMLELADSSSASVRADAESRARRDIRRAIEIGAEDQTIWAVENYPILAAFRDRVKRSQQ